MPNECVFCAIVKKQIPSMIVFENDDTVAFLDINPRSTGMTIVSPKKHYKEASEDFDASNKTFETAQVVAEMIKQSLSPVSIDFSIIPSKEVPHFHIRVYPVYENEIPLVENQPKKISEQELNEIAQKIRSVKVEQKKQEPVVEEVKEKPKERERSEDEIKWIRRQTNL